MCEVCGETLCCCDAQFSALDWVIVGGETGPGARPMHPDWVRDIRDQCAAANVPFFLKGMSLDGRTNDTKPEVAR
jgi:protein gp37